MRSKITLLLLLLITFMATTTQAPLPVAAQGCSDEAELIDQLIDPASSVIAPDSTFTVAWTFLNSGDCTWDRSYRLIFVKGDRMDSPRTLRLRGDVEPGDTVTISLELTAPSDADTYSGTWQLRNADGDNFGPALPLEIEVDASEASSGEVALPEVLAFGGMGEGEELNAIVYCVEDGVLPEAPALHINEEGLEFRYTSLYICGLSEGTSLTIEITDPEGNTFSRDFVEDAAVGGMDDAGNEYIGTVVQVPLGFLLQAPTGDWGARVTSDEFNDEITFYVPDIELIEGLADTDYPQLDNRPVTPIDPFAAADSCHYNYTPGQEMLLTGTYLPADATLQIGVYQERVGNGYLVDQLAIQTDDKGSFEAPYTALTEGGTFNVIILAEVNPEGYSENGVQYDFGFGGAETGFSCFSVVTEEEDADAIPLRLAYNIGYVNNSNIEVYDVDTGYAFYPTFTNDNCDASEPAWWPDGEWFVYQSNCIRDLSSDFIEMSAADDYDLYAAMIDPTYLLPEEEKLLRFTETPDINETEPDANMDGWIVYRKTPVGDSLDEVGELWLMDVFQDTNLPMGIKGRAPAWSPDGTRIAYMSDVDGSWQIYAYDLEADETWLVSEDCATHCRLPAWSPNGEQIIYHVSVSLGDITPLGMWIASVEGTAKPRRYLTGQYGRPSWSSEGWITFQGPDGIFRGTPGRIPKVERYLYSDPETAPLWGPDWKR